MYHSQIIRTLRPAVLNPARARAYTVTPPPTNQKTKQADNTIMYTTLGLVAAASAYYYFRNTKEGQELKDKAQANQDQMKRKSAELADAAKAQAEDAKQQGKTKLDQLKTDSKEKLGSVRSTAEGNLSRARDSTENVYNEGKSLAEEKATNVEAKIGQAKNGWFSWFNWGKSKADDTESEAERLKRKEAQTVANSAESVKERAEKHA